MTKRLDDATEALRDRPVQIEVTEEMIEAGVDELRDYALGDDLSYPS